MEHGVSFLVLHVRKREARTRKHGWGDSGERGSRTRLTVRMHVLLGAVKRCAGTGSSTCLRLGKRKAMSALWGLLRQIPPTLLAQAPVPKP